MFLGVIFCLFTLLIKSRSNSRFLFKSLSGSGSCLGFIALSLLSLESLSSFLGLAFDFLTFLVAFLSLDLKQAIPFSYSELNFFKASSNSSKSLNHKSFSLLALSVLKSLSSVF